MITAAPAQHHHAGNITLCHPSNPPPSHLSSIFQPTSPIPTPPPSHVLRRSRQRRFTLPSPQTKRQKTTPPNHPAQFRRRVYVREYPNCKPGEPKGAWGEVMILQGVEGALRLRWCR